MRIKDALVPNAVHVGLNNNQVELGVASASEAIENRIETVSEKNYRDQQKNYENQGFRVAEDTTTWSSVAVARSNVNIHSKHVNINNNSLSASRHSLSSSTDSLSDFDGQELSGGSDCSENSDQVGSPRPCRGIINPNYPDFQHLATSLLSVFTEEDPSDSQDSPRPSDLDSDNKVENNNKDSEKVEGDSGDLEAVNRLDERTENYKYFYEKSKLNIQTVTSLYEDVVSSEKCLNYVTSISETIENLQSNEENLNWHSIPVEIEPADLQSTSIDLPQFAELEKISLDGKSPDDLRLDRIDLIPQVTDLPESTIITGDIEDEQNPELSKSSDDSEALPGEQPYTKLEEIDLLSSIGRDIGVDLEKYVQPVPDVVAMEAVDVQTSSCSLPGLVKDTLREDTNKLMDQVAESVDARKKEKMTRNQARRRQQSHTGHQRRPDKRRADAGDKASDGFDVYNIETAMPKIDLDAIETHLRAAREEERRRRNDREEIRRRLAMGPDADDIRLERGRKPSLQSRLQSGMNLQICFMNETPSDTESPGSENDSSLKQTSYHSAAARPQMLSLPPLRLESDMSSAPLDEADFFARQARLQTEARMALAQAKEMAHMQMEVERQRLKQSPITEMVRSSLEKVGVQLGEDRRRLSRVLLTELNVAQLQVVANDLHARIAVLNEALVEGLLSRDDLHMEQDSMLVDVEDLTRYLGAKQESFKKRQASVKEQSPAKNRVHSQHIQAPPRQQSHVMMVMPSIRTRLAGRGFAGFRK